MIYYRHFTRNSPVFFTTSLLPAMVGLTRKSRSIRLGEINSQFLIIFAPLLVQNEFIETRTSILEA